MNLAIWNSLSKTDPAHTKQFNRAGGFKGTAIKPIWIVQRLTEQFGPCGIGWGIGKPEFQVVSADAETLVYCTVSCWHTREENVLFGVGGDKVVTKRQSGTFNDDEAFKKAFTDAVGNAFKFLGIGADVHMGRFDDSKYVREMEQEFSSAVQTGASEKLTEEQVSELQAMADEVGADVRKFCVYLSTRDVKINSLADIPVGKLDAARSALAAKRRKAA